MGGPCRDQGKAVPQVRATVQVTIESGEEESSNRDLLPQAEGAPKDSWRWVACPQQSTLERSSEAGNTALLEDQPHAVRSGWVRESCDLKEGNTGVEGSKERMVSVHSCSQPL